MYLCVCVCVCVCVCLCLEPYCNIVVLLGHSMLLRFVTERGRSLALPPLCGPQTDGWVLAKDPGLNYHKSVTQLCTKIPINGILNSFARSQPASALAATSDEDVEGLSLRTQLGLSQDTLLEQ